MSNAHTRARRRNRTVRKSNLRDLVEQEVSRQMNQPRTVEIDERFFDFSDFFPEDFVPKFSPKEYFEIWKANRAQ